MTYPTIHFMDPRHYSIHIKNILRWTEHNPDIQKNYQTITFAELTDGVGTITDDFSKIWQVCGPSIMEAIPHITGFPWNTEKDSVIEVFPIPFFNSFSHPLFLKVCSVRKGVIRSRSHGQILGTLIHEFLHHNIKALPAIATPAEEHACIDFAVIKLLDTYTPEYTKDYQDLQEKIGTKHDTSLVPHEVIAGQYTIRAYYEKKKETEPL